MKHTRLLSMLYDLVRSIGGEVRLAPLLDKTLQRLLFHTALPVGVVLARQDDSVLLATSIGSRALAARKGERLPVPLPLVDGGIAQLRDEQLAELGPWAAGYGYGLRLPVAGFGAIVLLGPASYTSELPLAELFPPVLDNLSRAVVLVRTNEQYAERLERDIAAATRSLSDAAERRRVLFDNSPDGIAVLDADHRVLEANRRFSAMLGYEPAEVLGIPATSLFAYPGEAELSATLHAAAEKPCSLEVLHRRKDANSFPAEVTINGALAGGEPVLMLVSHDITRRVEAQEALRHREEIYAAIVTQATYGVVLIELATQRFSEFNDAACGSLGYTRDEFARLRLSDLQADERDHFDRQARDILQHGAMQLQTRLRHKSGEVRDTLVSSRLLLIDGCEYVAALWYDVTDRIAADDQLRKLSAAVEQSPNAVVITDLAANIQYVNDAFTQNSGFSREEVLGKNPRFLKSGRTPAHVYREMWGALQQGQRWKGELVNRMKDGSERTESAIIVPLRDPDGRVTHYVAVKEDITSRKAQALELEAYREHLEKLVDQRTAELTAAKASADAANEAKSAFLANMSHEIRTPMNAIIGLTHLLRRDIQQQRHLEQLSKIAGAANHLLGIINDILDFSKIDAGRMTLDLTSFSVDKVFDDVAAMLMEKIEAKGLELVVDAGSLPASLYGDGLRLQQIILNFATNAVKFTERGQVVIAGRLLSTEHGNARVRIEVRDTGIGLTAEQRSRLFVAFEQGDLSTTRRYGGTGLGLVISRRLAQLMGGEVGCESVPGEGSVFWLEVPFGTRPLEVRPALSFPADRRVRSALVVESNEAARAAAVRVLRDAALHVEGVASVVDAIAATERAEAKKTPYALILVSSEHAPKHDVDGPRVLGPRLRATAPQSLLVLLGRGSDPPDAELLSAGWAGQIAKPFSPSSLLSALDALLRTRRGETIAPAASGEDLVAELVRRRGARVLLAEDNALNQEVALALLREVGLEVDVAENGVVAVQAAAARHYDLVLMDVQMPELDGLEATRRLRALPGHQHTPVLAMTANAFEEDRAACMAAGMNDYVAKPVEPEQLFRVLSRWLPAAVGASTPAAVAAPVAVEPNELVTRLGRLAGIDCEAGLRALRGDRAAYVRLLREFVARHGGDGERLRALFAGGDRESSARAAHTLKGVAGTLGLRALQQRAAALEAAHRGDAPTSELAACTEALAQSLTQTSAELAQTLGEAQLESAGAFDLAELRGRMGEVRRLIENDDAAAGERYRALHAAALAAFGSEANSLDRQLQEFDFEAALQTVARMLG